MLPYHLLQILPNLAGQKINEFFDIMRPLIEFSFAMILQRSNNIFELMTVDPIEVLLKVGFLDLFGLLTYPLYLGWWLQKH